MWRFSEIKVLPDIVSYWAAKSPAKIALKDGGLSLTYRELDESSNRIANRIIDSGIMPGSHIGYVGRNSIEFFEVWFGACKAGCAIAPFNWRCAVSELMELASDANIPLIFAESELCTTKVLEARERNGSSYEVVSFCIEGDRQRRFNGWSAEFSDKDPGTKVRSEDVALLVYTSGTTGRPKGVQYSHEAFNYSFLCMSLEPEMAWCTDDIGLMVVPNFHLGGNWVLLPALYHGATIRTVPAFDPELVLQAIATDRCTIVPLVPTALQVMLDHSEIINTDLSSLQKVIYFGSPIGAETMRKAVTRLGCKLNQLYGTTETWFAALLGHEEHIAEPPVHLASCGKPLPLIMMKICNTKGDELPDREVGEVYIRTPALNKGYWKNPQATEAAINDGWYRTGDLAWRDKCGYFYLVDRSKDMIVSGGENIYSVEVERALSLHEAVCQVAVIGVPDNKWGEKVIAFVALAQGSVVSQDMLIKHCREHIAGYKIPKEIFIKDALPMNLTGKIQKNILRNPYWSGKTRKIS